MSIATRVVVEKRLWVAAAASALALAVGLYVFAVFPWSARVESARVRAQAAGQDLVAARQAHDAARVMTASRSRAATQLRRFYTEVLPRDLAEARAITYLRFAELARRHDLVLEQRNSGPEGDEESALATLRSTMRLGGEWPDIRRFIDELEASPEFVVIEEVILSQDEELDREQALTLSVATYYEQVGGE